MTTDLIPLSASRLATYKKCSYIYYGSYVLKLPRGSNDGARRGTVVHSVFECLLNPRHRWLYEEILEKKGIKAIPLMNRFVRKLAKKQKLVRKFDNKGIDNYELIEQMILTGLKFDFFCEGNELENAETAFDYTNLKGTYRILGFIDKIARSSDGKLGIWDYKSSASKFSGDDLEDNVQAKMYSLYALRVRGMNSFVRFVFLRFPRQPIIKMQFSETELIEFEKMLEQVSQELKDFNLEKAYSNFAYDQGYGGGFKGLMVCGKAKNPGEKKEDGSPVWHCEYKFPYHYFALCNANDAVIVTSMIKDDLRPDESKGEYVIQKLFKGCPRFRSLEYSKNFLGSKK